MSDKKSVLKTIKDDDIAYVDLRFCDPRGKLQHVTVVSDLVDEDFLDAENMGLHSGPVLFVNGLLYKGDMEPNAIIADLDARDDARGTA